MSHAFGAAFDNPDLLVACVVGDGEAETGPAATGWHSNKFLDPRRDGAVLPVLHLNGYKIAAPTVLARIPTEELLSLFTGYGYRPVLVEGGFDGEDPMAVHQRMAAAMDNIFDEVAEIQERARSGQSQARPVWPMLILRTPKGWTGPKVVDGLPVEGTFRSTNSRYPEFAPTRNTWPSSRRGSAATDRMSCSTGKAGPSTSSPAFHRPANGV